MKLGLIADVRGLLSPLDTALRLLSEAGCDGIACLGSTVEGGEDDAEVLDRLAKADARLLPSPHDADEGVLSRESEIEEAGLRLAHATPEELAPDQMLWLTGCPAPDVLRVRESLSSQVACGDLFAPILYAAGAPAGEPGRRLFLSSETVTVPEGGLLLCPGSVALATSDGRGGSVATWDEAARELRVLRFGPGGPLEPSPPVVLVYCEDFDPHLPEPELLERVALTVQPSADDIVEDVRARRPDVVLLDQHLAGRKTGVDALIALGDATGVPKPPVLAIAGSPDDSTAMKSAGAVGGLPFTYLKDTFARLLRELVG